MCLVKTLQCSDTRDNEISVMFRFDKKSDEPVLEYKNWGYSWFKEPPSQVGHIRGHQPRDNASYSWLLAGTMAKVGLLAFSHAYEHYLPRSRELDR